GVSAISDHSAKRMYWNIFSFLTTRVIAAMFLGLALGFLGSSFFIPNSLKLFFQLCAGVIMVLTALSFINIKFPSIVGFSYLWEKLSNGIFKVVNSHSYFSPILLGIISLL